MSPRDPDQDTDSVILLNVGDTENDNETPSNSDEGETRDVESGDGDDALAHKPDKKKPSPPSQPALVPTFLANLRASPATKNPKATLQAVYAAGEYKAGLSLNILMVQSFMVSDD